PQDEIFSSEQETGSARSYDINQSAKEINMPNQGALSGIKVLDLSRLLPGPYCSMILADHGARVIAIEDKRFMDDGLFFSQLYRNKEHMSLNLKTEEGKKIFFRLANDADVILEGFRPGVVQRLGVDYDTVLKVNPKIIYCSISGYGQTGEYRDRAGHDVNYLSISGALDLIGQANHPPSIPGIQIADIAGGGMNAAIGILMALFSRERTGKGQYIDISMTDGLVSFMPFAFFFKQITGQFPKRGDSILSHRYACYNTYETADGRYISVGTVENRFWENLCKFLEVPEYTPLQYDENRRQEIIDFMKTTFRKKTFKQWKKDLAGIDACCEPIQNFSEVLKNPLFREREMIVEVTGKDGIKTLVIGVPVKLSETPGSVITPPVAFGENTEAILKELGYSKKQIKELSDMEVI
ncbi:MAG: CaiB/BaiF CoA-transferase family protein, partial [Desulfobacterales bacterium]|nr:CaiB/BaiF CoA-transferase family protein [Desulfobacterales bacterium]MDX2508095.1 CaiB/BaiF CoA-transferase family protein [Desulfobacterales bacterium]